MSNSAEVFSFIWDLEEAFHIVNISSFDNQKYFSTRRCSSKREEGQLQNILHVIPLGIFSFSHDFHEIDKGFAHSFGQMKKNKKSWTTEDEYPHFYFHNILTSFLKNKMIPSDPELNGNVQPRNDHLILKSLSLSSVCWSNFSKVENVQGDDDQDSKDEGSLMVIPQIIMGGETGEIGVINSINIEKITPNFYEDFLWKSQKGENLEGNEQATQVSHPKNNLNKTKYRRSTYLIKDPMKQLKIYNHFQQSEMMRENCENWKSYFDIWLSNFVSLEKSNNLLHFQNFCKRECLEWLLRVGNTPKFQYEYEKMSKNDQNTILNDDILVKFGFHSTFAYRIIKTKEKIQKINMRLSNLGNVDEEEYKSNIKRSLPASPSKNFSPKKQRLNNNNNSSHQLLTPISHLSPSSQELVRKYGRGSVVDYFRKSRKVFMCELSNFVFVFYF